MHPTKEQFHIALKEIEEFSPAPVILANALRLLRDPKSDIESIAALIGHDAALTAALIRCANSVYYGGSTCGNIGEAVQKVGLRETIRLLNLAVARIVSSRDLDCYGINGTDFWAESLFNGLFMQTLAKQTGATDPDEAYTVGLLRYLGRLAINQTIVHLRSGLFWAGEESITKWELDNVGLPQALVGGMLLRKWNFPAQTVEAVGGQDSPSTLAAGNWLADALYFSSSILPQGVGTPFLPAAGLYWSASPFGSDFMHRHDLKDEAVDALLDATSRSFDQIREQFGA